MSLILKLLINHSSKTGKFHQRSKSKSLSHRIIASWMIVNDLVCDTNPMTWNLTIDSDTVLDHRQIWMGDTRLSWLKVVVLNYESQRDSLLNYHNVVGSYRARGNARVSGRWWLLYVFWINSQLLQNTATGEISNDRRHCRVRHRHRSRNR